MTKEKVEICMHERGGYSFARVIWGQTIVSEALPVGIETWPKEEWKAHLKAVALRLKERVAIAKRQALETKRWLKKKKKSENPKNKVRRG